MSTNELMGLIAQMAYHCRQGGAGYTWLDAMIDVVGEHGYVILNQNGDSDGPTAILINDATLGSTRQLIERPRQIGVATEMASGGNLAELDEEANMIHEILNALLIELLVEASLVQPLVVDEYS